MSTPKDPKGFDQPPGESGPKSQAPTGDQPNSEPTPQRGYVTDETGTPPEPPQPADGTPEEPGEVGPDSFSSAGSDQSFPPPMQYVPQGEGTESASGFNPSTAPQAEAEPAKKSKWSQYLTFGLILVVVFFFGIGLWNQFNDKVALQVGNCLVLSGSDTNVTHKAVSCDDTSVISLKIASKNSGDEACVQPYTPYEVLTKNGDKILERYCMMEMLQENTCYREANNTIGMEVTECNENADFKVTKVLDGTTDANQCSADEKALVFGMKDYERVYCSAPPA